MRQFRSFFLISALIILFDQLSKWTIRHLLEAPIPLLGEFLQISFVRNFGAGFGMLQGQRIILSLVSMIVIVLILYNYPKFKGDRVQFVAFALILGGAIGNLIDRLFIGFVTDFISFSFFPSFNVADSCISIGACLLIFQEIRMMSKKKPIK